MTFLKNNILFNTKSESVQKLHGKNLSDFCQFFNCLSGVSKIVSYVICEQTSVLHVKIIK